MPIRVICIDKSLKNGPGYLLAGGSYPVGRSSRCSFIIGDLSVSRFHAELTALAEAVHVKDSNSRNGTFVDGMRIEEAEVRPGQSVRFGNAQFQVVGDQEVPVDAPELSGVSTRFIQGKPKLQPAAVRTLLSKREWLVLKLLLAGLPERAAAARLFISQNTMHNHVKAIYRKLQVTSRSELLALFISD